MLVVGASPVTAEELKVNRQALEGIPGNYWPKPLAIPVCYRLVGRLPRNDVASVRVRTRAWVERTWQANSGLTFTGWGTCSGTPAGIEVRLQIIGRSNADQGPGDDGVAIINLSATASAATIVHEFGHALNFGHSQLREDRPSYCIAGPGGSTLAKVEDELTSYDADSIMNYCRVTGRRSGYLSPLDVAGLIEVYGDNRRNRLGRYERNDLFATAIAAGDVNGDGAADIAIGAPGEALGSEQAAGTGFLYVSTPNGALRPVTGFDQTGLGKNEAHDRFGQQVLMADLDGDGKDEVVTFAPWERPGSDRGTRGAMFAHRVVVATPAPTGIPVMPQDFAVEPVALYVPTVAVGGAQFAGLHQAAKGDLDGDGREEIWFADSVGGSVRIHGVELNAQNKFEVVDTIGFAPPVAAISLAVVNIGAPHQQVLVAGLVGRDAADRAGSGLLKTYHLNDGQLSLLQTLSPDDDRPQAREDDFARRLAVADFNGDGREDLAVAAATAAAVLDGARGGVVEIYHGSAQGLVHRETLSQESTGAGASEALDAFGLTLAGGDFDGDGFGDLAIATNEQVPDFEKRPGYVFLVYGSMRNGLGRGHYISQHPVGADEDGDQFGRALAAADLDGDGADELIVGAPLEAPGKEPAAGFAFVYRTPYRPMEAWYAFGQQF